MIDLIHRPGPDVRGRLRALLDSLESLRDRFKDAIAHLLGGSAAQAVRDLVRGLLGLADPKHERTDSPAGWAGEDDPWAGDGRWDEGPGSTWDDARWRNEPPREEPRQRGWLHALLLAVLGWLGPLASLAVTLIA